MVDLVTRGHQLSVVARRTEVVVTAHEALVADSTEAALHTAVAAHACHAHTRGHHPLTNNTTAMLIIARWPQVSAYCI